MVNAHSTQTAGLAGGFLRAKTEKLKKVLRSILTEYPAGVYNQDTPMVRFWAYIPPHDALCPSNVPPEISLQTANLMIWKGQYIRAQSIKKSPQTQSYQGFTSL